MTYESLFLHTRTGAQALVMGQKEKLVYGQSITDKVGLIFDCADGAYTNTKRAGYSIL